MVAAFISDNGTNPYDIADYVASIKDPLPYRGVGSVQPFGSEYMRIHGTQTTNITVPSDVISIKVQTTQISGGQLRHARRQTSN